jgi:hypothetical protein
MFTPGHSLTTGLKQREIGVGHWCRSCQISVDLLNSKVSWVVSLDGKKAQSETYKVLAVMDSPLTAMYFSAASRTTSERTYNDLALDWLPFCDGRKVKSADCVVEQPAKRWPQRWSFHGMEGIPR